MWATDLEVLFGHEQSFDDTRDVAQIELVEKFARSRAELRFDEYFLEHAVECFDAAVAHGLNLFIELFEVVGHDALEDTCYGVIWRLGYSESGEEALHAVRDVARAHFRVE